MNRINLIPHTEQNKSSCPNRREITATIGKAMMYGTAGIFMAALFGQAFLSARGLIDSSDALMFAVMFFSAAAIRIIGACFNEE